MIPKSEPGKWRLIVDLSSPKGASVNDGISKELCSLSYVHVDDIVPPPLATDYTTVSTELTFNASTEPEL